MPPTFSSAMLIRRRPEMPQRILVRAPNWLGDLVMATPAFRAMRAGFPEAQLSLLLREEHIPILNGAPWFDALLPHTSFGRGFARLLAEGHRLRAKRFDLGICLPDSFRAALLMRMAGVGYIVGYRRGLRGPLLHRALPPPGQGPDPFMVSREQHELGIVRALGCPASDTTLGLFATAQEETEAALALERNGLHPQAPRVVVAPGASFGTSKLWPPAFFAEVADGLAEAGLGIALIGAPHERALAAQVGGVMRAPVANLAGEISLGATKAVIAGARLVLCNDAGARHIAVAFRVPCVVLMGPTALEKTDCNLEGVHVLTAEDVDCRPCYLRICPIDHRCMTRIVPARVVEVALATLHRG